MEEALFGDEFGAQPLNTVRQGEDCVRRLKELGISQEKVQLALRAGDQAARQADKFSPKTAAGLQRWTNTVQELRRGLAIDGWECDDPKNSPRIVSADGKVSLAVVTGDSCTGVRDQTPQNAHALGSMMEDSILNSDAKQVVGQQTIDVIDDFATKVLETGPTTWLLMYKRTAAFGLRAEISRPALVHDRFIHSWKERLIMEEELFFDEDVPLDADTDDVYFEIREA